MWKGLCPKSLIGKGTLFMCGYVEKMQIHMGTEHDNNIIFQDSGLI
jgi:hypothetical protein